jgi:hypothetical protein
MEMMIGKKDNKLSKGLDIANKITTLSSNVNVVRRQGAVV